MKPAGIITPSQFDSVPQLTAAWPASSDSRTPRALEERGVTFSEVLANVAGLDQGTLRPINRWQQLNFLKTSSAPRVVFPWTQGRLETMRGVDVPDAQLTAGGHRAGRAMSLADYPRPPQDNGWGVHWIPTVAQPPEVVDEYVKRAVAMGMKWVVFLNDGANIGANDYLVKRLTAAGIEPVMRVYTPGLTPISGDLQAMVRHYVGLGVHYFQLYNEPNLMVETGGQPPDVSRYLDLWLPAAEQVVAAGGLPGFGALSPQGEMDDRIFLREALAQLKARGQVHILDHAWLAMHNYTGARPLDDPDGFLRFRQYDAIIQSELGRQLPIIGTEGGTHISEHVSQEQQIKMVTQSYNYMRHREPYNFAYTYWIIANGHDPAWENHALFRADGPTALAQALTTLATGGRV